MVQLSDIRETGAGTADEQRVADDEAVGDTARSGRSRITWASPFAPNVFRTSIEKMSQAADIREAERRAKEATRELEATFQQLAEQWMRETAAQSFASHKIMHPAYQRIIAMGDKAIPMILRELQRRPHHWFWALRMITNESPIPQQAQGNMRAMSEAWLEWGRQKGYLA